MKIITLFLIDIFFKWVIDHRITKPIIIMKNRYEKIDFCLRKDGTIDGYGISIVPNDYLNSYYISFWTQNEILESILNNLKKDIIKIGQRCKGAKAGGLDHIWPVRM